MSFEPEYITCEVCGGEDPAGTGYWAAIFEDVGNHNVHRGKCWRWFVQWQNHKEILSQLDAWLPELELSI